jgi:hypothetical protein
MLEIPIIGKPLDKHIEPKIQVFNENYESTCWHGGNSSHVVATRPILTFAPCMSNSLSFGKLMKLYENLVEICPILIGHSNQMNFVPPTYCVWCQIQVLVENLCNYMKRWLKFILFGGH